MVQSAKEAFRGNQAGCHNTGIHHIYIMRHNSRGGGNAPDHPPVASAFLKRGLAPRGPSSAIYPDPVPRMIPHKKRCSDIPTGAGSLCSTGGCRCCP